MWEGGRIQALMMDLDVGVCSKAEKDQKKKLLVDYLFSSRGHHNWYAGRYFFCEVLAMANVVFQMYALDRFFDGEFLTYGLQVIEFSQLDQGKPFHYIFTFFPIFKFTLCHPQQKFTFAIVSIGVRLNVGSFALVHIVTAQFMLLSTNN